MRARFTWRLRSRELSLGGRTLLMGVVNVTPDSFSDGGRFLRVDHAVGHALRLLDEGADILDIGGESTRPGTPVADHAQVTAEEELGRVLPVIEAIRCERPDAILSVDTYKAETARQAVLSGAEIVNDVSAGRWDALMFPTLADLACGAILMHARGRPEEWRALPKVANLVDLVRHDLDFLSRKALQAGVDRERIALDPGFGFGKNYDENYPLLAHFADLAALGYPLVAGTSRKGFIGRTLRDERRLAAPVQSIQDPRVADRVAQATSPVQDRPVDGRLHGTVATVTASILGGAHIVRVHDVAACRDAARVADEILRAKG